MRIPLSRYRQFLSEISFSETRLVRFGGPEKQPCDKGCNPTVEPLQPTPDPVSNAPAPKKEPDFSDMKFDLRPDEPTHIYEKGKVKENGLDQIRDMNKEQFQAHLGKMFSKHMGDQMKLERTRQNQLARGKRKAEARDRFADTKKGRKAAEKWADKALADSDVTFNEAEAEVAKIQATPEALFGPDEFKDMLQQITDDVWSTAEFQRGTVNYLKAYDKAWNMYIDLAEQHKNNQEDEKGIADHPLFRSGAFTTRRAPGIYQNGELIRVPSTFPGIGNRPTSTYAAAKVRERAGVAQNPDRDFLKKEEQTVRDGYERAWRKSFRKKNAGALDSKKEDAFVQKNVDNQLRKQGFQQAKVDASRAPDEDALRLPPEADRKTEQDFVNAHENIDARDRGAVVGTLSKTLGLNVGSVKEFNKKVRLGELTLLSMDADMPQILHYSTKQKVRRGEVQEPAKSGLAILDRSEEDAGKSPEVSTIDFADVGVMLKDGNPWTNGFLHASNLKDAHRSVRGVLKSMVRSDRDIYNPATYQNLVPVCRQQGISNFAIDELSKLCAVSNRAVGIAQTLQSTFANDISVMQNANSWSNDQLIAIKKIAGSSDNRPILKAILEEHCLKNKGGDMTEDAFNEKWTVLTEKQTPDTAEAEH